MIEQPYSGMGLTDREMGNLLVAVGNHEGKAVLVIGMQPGVIYGLQGLHHTFNSLQIPSIGWDTDNMLQRNWCRSSLEPIGLIAEEITDQWNNLYGYALTDRGIQLGVPLAGLMLDYSYRHLEFSLGDIFGDTTSSYLQKYPDGFQLRSAHSRLVLFRHLLETELPTTQMAILKNTSLQRNFFANLESLSDSGIITYDSVEADKPISYYTATGTEPPETFRRDRRFQERIVRVFEERRGLYLSFPDLLGVLGNDSRSFVNRVRFQLSHLVKNGFLEHQKFGSHVFSDINLTDAQREALKELVATLDGFQQMDPGILELGKQKAEEFRNDKLKVSTLLHKAQKHSSESNSVPFETTIERVIAILQENPNLTSREVRKELKSDRFGQNLSRHSVGNILHKMEKRGIIKRGESKHTLTWGLIERS